MTMTRREFLAITAAAGASIVIAVRFPSSAAEAPSINPIRAWLRLTPDGKLAIIVARSEMGQGVSTSLPMVVAEEACIAWHDVSVEQAETLPEIYGDQGTGGSGGIRNHYEPLRKAGACIRELMIEAASRQWHVAPDECRAAASVVTHSPTGRTLTYVALFDAASKLPVPDQKSVRLKKPSEFTLIGKEIRRVDAPSKVDGSARFGIDVRVPDMLFAVVARCPTFGGKVAQFDASKTLAVPGVVRVFEIPAHQPSHTAGGVVVAANNTWAALQGRNALAITWDHGPHAKENSSQLRQQLLEATSASGKVVLNEGSIESALAAAPHRVEAVYEFPFLAHATMEPMNVTAIRTAAGFELYAPSQSPNWIQATVAKAFSLDPARVVVHTTQMGGGFGRRYDLDFAMEGAQIADVLRRPVQVVWSREDDMTHDFYRPACVHRISGALDANGHPIAWQDRISSTSIRAFWEPSAPAEQQEISGADDNLYAIPHFRVEYKPVASGVPVGWWRSVAGSFNVFVVESFIDEMAAAAKIDPYRFRERLLVPLSVQNGKRDPEIAQRLLNVIRKAVALSGWDKRGGRGRGRGMAAQPSYDSYIACVVDVAVNGGRIDVERVVSVVDCGTAVNPNGVRAQMESAIVFGLSAALKGEITITNGAADQNNFDGYDPLRMPETPAIEVHVVNSGRTVGGMGEAGVPLIGPALANAIFDATGTRLRRLPLRLDRV